MSVENKDIIVRRHPGATADEMLCFIKDSVNRFRPTKLIIFAGCNDVSRAHRDNKEEIDIVNSIITMAMEGKKYGCKDVFVSSILTRRGQQQHGQTIERVNSMLENVCKAKGLIYLSHSDVGPEHISADGIHPNGKGTTILLMNILSCFDGFDPLKTTIYGQYESIFK